LSDVSTGAAGRFGGRRTSLPLLISLFLAALVGVFPGAATAGTPATAASVTALAPSAHVGAADRAAETPSTEHSAGADQVVAGPPLLTTARAASARTVRTEVRAPADQDVHAATAPRAPPLHLV
jgi:hypothetical protein